MKKKIVLLTLAAVLALSATACSSGGGGGESSGGGDATTSDVANKDKPLVWYNRQPSNSSTGELDMTALNFNDDTYYVGFDANQGAELQGTMVKDYIEAHIDEIDRNGDGLSDMFWQSVISDITILSHVQEVSVQHLEQALRQTAQSTVSRSERTQTDQLPLYRTDHLRSTERHMQSANLLHRR